MPELPEVETVVRGITPYIENSTIIDLVTSSKKLRIPYPNDFYDLICNKKITNVQRRSKYVLITLNDEVILIIHLGMSGKLLIGDTSHKLFNNKHTHVTFELSNDHYMLFNDPRRFGLVTTCKTHELEEHKLFAHLGAEPLTEDLNTEYLFKLLQNKKTNIKQIIMDASNVVGVGNIYACEALFRSKIHPLCKGNEITHKQTQNLVENIKQVLLEAINAGGSTLKDYTQSNGDNGYFQHKFFVYGRKDQPCMTCNISIENIKISGRSSFFCPKCQDNL